MLADGRRRAIGSDARTIIERERGSMRQEGIFFHLAHALAALIGTSIEWLPGQLSARSTIASGDFVEDHMFQSLLKAGANEPRTIHNFARRAIDHRLFGAVSLLDELFKSPLGRNILKRTCIRKITENKT